MNREDKRRAVKFARQRGVSVNKPDLSIVTAHHESDYIQVITEQSSYIIDLKSKRA